MNIPTFWLHKRLAEAQEDADSSGVICVLWNDQGPNHGLYKSANTLHSVSAGGDYTELGCRPDPSDSPPCQRASSRPVLASYC